MIDWKEAARHFRRVRIFAEKRAVSMEIKYVDERQRRLALATAFADLLMDIAYDDDDANNEYCNVCHRSLIEEDGHQSGCLLIAGLTLAIEGERR